MREETAKILIDFLLDQAKQQDQFLLDNQKIMDSQDFDQVRMIIAHTMGAIYSDGLRPLLEEHPGLTLDGLRV